MHKYMLCLLVGVAAGCAEPPATAPSASTSSDDAVALVKFSCPTMT